MTIQTQAITITAESIQQIGARKAARSGRPRKGVTVDDRGLASTFSLSATAKEHLTRAAKTLGVSESALIESLANALSSQIDYT